MLVGVHQRGRGIGRHRRLADRQHVRRCRSVRKSLEEFDQIVDIIVEVEAAVVERHELRVAPVGDIDVMLGSIRSTVPRSSVA